MSYLAQQPVFQVRVEYGSDSATKTATIENVGPPAISAMVTQDVIVVVRVPDAAGTFVGGTRALRRVNFYDVPPPAGATRYGSTGPIYVLASSVPGGNMARANSLLVDLRRSLTQQYGSCGLTQYEFVTVAYLTGREGVDGNQKSFLLAADVFYPEVDIERLTTFTALVDEPELWLVLGKDDTSTAVTQFERALRDQPDCASQVRKLTDIGN